MSVFVVKIYTNIIIMTKIRSILLTVDKKNPLTPNPIIFIKIYMLNKTVNVSSMVSKIPQ